MPAKLNTCTIDCRNDVCGFRTMYVLSFSMALSVAGGLLVALVA